MGVSDHRSARPPCRTSRKEGEALIRLTTGDRTAPNLSGAGTKRTLRAARLALLVIPFLVAAAAMTARADAVATVIPPDGLHLRAGPGPQHASLGVIAGGTRIALTGPENESGWYPAVFLGKRGWVIADFVEAPSEATVVTRQATVKPNDGLILREEPHAGAARLTTMPAGAAVTVRVPMTSDGWVLTAYAGQTGWANGEFLGYDAAATPPATPAPTMTPVRTGTQPSPTSSPLPSGMVRALITYYHPSLEGGPMACGGRYRGEDATIAAAVSWPCGTKLRVCRNSNCVVVTVQDTGHLAANQVDLSAAAFRQLAPLPDAQVTGTVEVVRD